MCRNFSSFFVSRKERKERIEYVTNFAIFAFFAAKTKRGIYDFLSDLGNRVPPFMIYFIA